MDTDVDATVRETPEYLEALARRILPIALKEEPEWVVTEGPTVGAIAGHGAVTFALRNALGPVAERWAIIVSDEHDRFWFVVLRSESSVFDAMRPTFEAMLSGFRITLVSPSLRMAAYAVVGAAGAVVLGIVLLARRGRVRSRGAQNRA